MHFKASTRLLGTRRTTSADETYFVMEVEVVADVKVGGIPSGVVLCGLD